MSQGKRRRGSLGDRRNLTLANNGGGVFRNITQAEQNNKYEDNNSRPAKIPKVGTDFGNSARNSRYWGNSSRSYPQQRGSEPTFMRNERNQLVINLNSFSGLPSSHNTNSSKSSPSETTGSVPVLQISTTSTSGESKDGKLPQATATRGGVSTFKKQGYVSGKSLPLPGLATTSHISRRESGHDSGNHSPKILPKISTVIPNNSRNSPIAVGAKDKTPTIAQKNICSSETKPQEETTQVPDIRVKKSEDKTTLGKENGDSTLPKTSPEEVSQRYDDAHVLSATQDAQSTKGKATLETISTTALGTGSNTKKDHYQSQPNTCSKENNPEKDGENTLRTMSECELVKVSTDNSGVVEKELEKKNDTEKVAKLATSSSPLPCVVTHKSNHSESNEITFTPESSRARETSQHAEISGKYNVGLARRRETSNSPNFAPETKTTIYYASGVPAKNGKISLNGSVPARTSPPPQKYPGGVLLHRKIYKKSANYFTKPDIRYIYSEMTEEQALRRSWKYRSAFKSIIYNRRRNSIGSFQGHKRNSVSTGTGSKNIHTVGGVSTVAKEEINIHSIENGDDKSPKKILSKITDPIESAAICSSSATASFDVKPSQDCKRQSTDLSVEDKSSIHDNSLSTNRKQSEVIPKNTGNLTDNTSESKDTKPIGNVQNSSNISVSTSNILADSDANHTIKPNKLSDSSVLKFEASKCGIERIQSPGDNKKIQENSKINEPVNDIKTPKPNLVSSLKDTDNNTNIFLEKKVDNEFRTAPEATGEVISEKPGHHSVDKHIETKCDVENPVNDDEFDLHDSMPLNAQKSSPAQVEGRLLAEAPDTKSNFRSQPSALGGVVSSAHQNAQNIISDTTSFTPGHSGTLHRVKKLTKEIMELKKINLTLKKKLGKLSNEVVNYETKLSSIVGMMSEMKRYRETMGEVYSKLFATAESEDCDTDDQETGLLKVGSHIINSAYAKRFGCKSPVESEFLSLETQIVKRITEYKASEILLMERQKVLGEIGDISDISALSESPFVKELKDKLLLTSKCFREYRESMAHRLENLKQGLKKKQQELAASKEELGKYSRDNARLINLLFQLREKSKNDKQVIEEQRKKLDIQEQALKARENMSPQNMAQRDTSQQIHTQYQQLAIQSSKLWTSYKALYGQCTVQQSKIRTYEESLKYARTQVTDLQEKLHLQNEEMNKISNQRTVEYGPGGNLFWKAEYDKLLQAREKERNSFRVQIANIHKSYYKLLSDREKGYQAVIDSMNEIVGSDVSGSPGIGAFQASFGNVHNGNMSSPILPRVDARNGQQLVGWVNLNDAAAKNGAGWSQASSSVHSSVNVVQQSQHPAGNMQRKGTKSTNQLQTQSLFVNPDDSVPEPTKLRYTMYVPENSNNLDGRGNKIGKQSATET